MRYGVVVILVTAFIFGCNGYYYDEDIQSVVNGINKFTGNVYQEIAKESENKNIVVSGLSTELVLSLLANGAKGNTRTQILKGLNLPVNLESINYVYSHLLQDLAIDTYDVKLVSANKIYPAERFAISKAFNNTAVNLFKGGVESIDFENTALAINTINQWIEKQTNKKIRNLLSSDEVSSATTMILVNTLYFRGQWRKIFVKFATKKRPFYVSTTETKEVDMMSVDDFFNIGYDEKLQAKFLEMDFKGGDISMTFVLPDNITGLKLIEENLEQCLAPRKMSLENTVVNIPKFKIESKINFNPILKTLGMTDLFETHLSDLSGISHSGGLTVANVFQKVFIDCNEDGVEAAAATGFGSFRVAPQYFFEANHPFFFYIREKKTKIILFAGRYKQ